MRALYNDVINKTLSEIDVEPSKKAYCKVLGCHVCRTEVEVLKEPEPQHLTGTSENDIIALLKKYKELLDNGIITEEEFNKKKSELLG